MNKLLVTGGAGYIGSHTSLLLLQAGFDVVVIDNLSNGSRESLRRVAKIAGRKVEFVLGDIRDKALLKSIFASHSFSAVLHFAGLKAVGESVLKPFDYYENNVAGTLALCESMVDAGVFSMVFSSSATVYGDSMDVPITELQPTGKPTNPYGRSKLIIEEILSDLANADSRWRVAVLRYFNPAGAHESGQIGEDPKGLPNNLLPFIAKVAAGKLPEVSVFGGDYPTPDGTGVRDYIHVMDLAEGHLRAIQALQTRTGIHVWNLGTGQGYSVLQMINTFQEISGRAIPFHIAARRSGDIATCYADPSKAASELGWMAKKSLHDMIQDSWRWQSKNPDGYS